MNIIKAPNLACPIDATRLVIREKQLVCDNGHAFDIARQGYVNLLPVQHKRTKNPGDSKAMVSARTEFLSAGFYQPIAHRLAEITQLQLSRLPLADDGACLLDAGCGEGYYLDYVCNALSQSEGDSSLSLVGLDISKPAITEAAKRNRQVSWIVGTNRQPPLLPDSVDMILCVFGFQSFEGFNRVLKPGGIVVLVEPGPEHLNELREIIYSEVKKTPPPDLGHAQVLGFTLEETMALQFKIFIENCEQINHLLIMTPHFYRAKQAGRDAAAQLQSLNLGIDIVFRVLRKTAPAHNVNQQTVE